MKDSHKEELNRMSDQLKAKDAQIDRLIKMAQSDDNQWFIFFIFSPKVGQFSDGRALFWAQNDLQNAYF